MTAAAAVPAAAARSFEVDDAAAGHLGDGGAGGGELEAALAALELGEGAGDAAGAPSPRAEATRWASC